MKNIIKFILKILGCLGVLVTIFILLVILFEPISPKSDYCIEDGDCKEGRIIIINNKEILINKDTCSLNDWEWYERSKTCIIPTGTFKVKEVIYE